jgi:nitroimidazol reductase NimA-like FMN-containing flavoprotein (pyridoxamine 5'-phosphate oxidase superfamily)
MHRSEKQITDIAELKSILSKGTVCFLSMVDDGMPYVVPLNYGYDGKDLYFHSAPEGRKIDMLGKNPDVCFCVVGRCELVPGEKACSWSTRYSSVIGTGRARILTDQEEKEKGLAILMRQYSDKEYDFTGMKLEGVSVIKVEIEEISGKQS